MSGTPVRRPCGQTRPADGEWTSPVQRYVLKVYLDDTYSCMYVCVEVRVCVCVCVLVSAYVLLIPYFLIQTNLLLLDRVDFLTLSWKWFVVKRSCRVCVCAYVPVFVFVFMFMSIFVLVCVCVCVCVCVIALVL